MREKRAVHFIILYHIYVIESFKITGTNKMEAEVYSKVDTIGVQFKSVPQNVLFQFSSQKSPL